MLKSSKTGGENNFFNIVIFNPGINPDFGMINIEHFNDTIIVSLNKLRRIDFLIFEKLRNRLLQIIESTSNDVYFDLSNVLFIDSNSFSGLKFIIYQAAENGIKFGFINVSDELIELFNLVDEKNIFRIYRKNEIEQLRVIPV